MTSNLDGVKSSGSSNHSSLSFPVDDADSSFLMDDDVAADGTISPGMPLASEASPPWSILGHKHYNKKQSMDNLPIRFLHQVVLSRILWV